MKFVVLIKKEIKELLTIQMILPLIIMVIVFGMLGEVISKETAKLSVPQSVLVLNQDEAEIPTGIISNLSAANINLINSNASDVSGLIEQAQSERLSVVLVIPDGFNENLNDFKQQQLPVYKILNNFSVVASVKFQSADKAIAIINDYFSNDWIKKNKINIEPNILKNPIQTNEFVALTDKVANVPFNSVYGFVQQQTTFIPIILFFVIIVASQMVAMTVANEKENKTLEILLSSPISRKTIVFSKLVGAGLVALLFAAVYMVGFYNYLSSLSPKADITGDIGLAIASLGISLGVGSYLLLGVSLFLGILVALAIAMILGVLIDSIKNIQAVITPLMILVLLPYLLVMFLDFNSLSPIFKGIIYAIPFSHPFLAIQQMLVHNYLAVILGIVYQFIVFIIFVVIAAKIFSSDKILTLKLNFGKRKKMAG